MKNIKKLFVVLLVVAFFANFAFSVDFGANGAKDVENPTLEQMLTYAIQDEYLARAEYIDIIDKFGNVRPFANILKAEIYHVSLLVPLFEKYKIEKPVDNAHELVVLPPDMKTALEIGVQAEIDNIAMYESFLKLDLPDDVRDVFEELMNASKNHLKAFENGLKKY